MSNWQPIETAPHDTPVLIFGRSGGMTVARRDSRWGWEPVGIDGYDWEFEFWVTRENAPTHWMPLPSGPSAASEEPKDPA